MTYQYGGKMKKGITIIIAAIITFVVIIATIIGFNNRNQLPKSKAGFELAQVENSYKKFSEIYQEDYQNAIHEQVNLLKQKYRYDIENPLLIQNPYSTVTNGLYMYFETRKDMQVRYTVSCEGFDDYTNTVYQNDEDNLSKVHEFLMIGLITGQKNTITVELLDSKDKVKDSVTFTYDCPEAIGSYNVNQVDVVKGESTQQLSNGLYVLLGNDVEADPDNEDIKAAYISMYDNNGVLRVEMPCVSYRAHRFIFDEDGMYFSVSGGRIVRMDATGYVNRVYKLGDYLLHHDYIFGTNNDIIVLGSDYAMGTKEDLILSIDIDTAEVSVLIDLKDVFPEYYAMTEKPEGSEYLDWMHINTVDLIGEDSLLLSSRETSTIIKLDSIYDNVSIDYLIGSDEFWEGTGYEEYVLEKVGDFSLHAGQHTVTYQPDESLEEGQYYIYMYNNNNTISTTRPEYDWKSDSNYSNTGVFTKSNGANSSYYKYLVDTNERTYSLVDKIEVPYSGYVSSAQEYGGNIVIDSGRALAVWEYDSEGELIQELNFVGEHWIYRIYKYDFAGYWFK